VAGWIGITQPGLSRIEHGGPVVHLDRLIQWAKALGIPCQYLWFLVPDSPRSGTQDMRRHRFPTATRATVAGAPVGSVVPTSHARDLATAILGRQRPAEDPAPLTELTKQVTAAWQLRQRANYDALGQLLPSLLAEAQARADKTDTAEQAIRVVAHTYNAASSLLRKLGDEALALVAADRAVRTACALGDPLLTAAALYRLANVLLSARRPEETKAVALRAADLIEPGKQQTPRSLALWGGLLLTAAVAAARAADESAAWELMGEARVASRLLATDHADIYAIFGPCPRRR
jgi:transcriptional regulator with XRE-family HTH domain